MGAVQMQRLPELTAYRLGQDGFADIKFSEDEEHIVSLFFKRGVEDTKFLDFSGLFTEGLKLSTKLRSREDSSVMSVFQQVARPMDVYFYVRYHEGYDQSGVTQGVS